jgi:hypothetical protein
MLLVVTDRSLLTILGVKLLKVAFMISDATQGVLGPIKDLFL